MLDQLFQRPAALRRQRTGPLLEERLRYLGDLADQGMARVTLRAAAVYVLIVVEALRLAARGGERILLSEIRIQAASAADRSHPTNSTAHQRCQQHFLWHASQFLRFLDRLQPLPSRPRPYADHVAAFADYMSREQGLSPQTVVTRCRAIELFLDRLSAPNHSLAEVVLTHIDEALMQHISAGGCSRRTVATLACTLRGFFRYAQRRGWCCQGLAEGIKAPRVFPLESLPAGPSWDEVRRLLATTDTERLTDIRDRAILMLLAVYGLRAGEVVRLRLEDFDWHNEILSLFRPKTRRTQTFPLSRPVGDAVLRYLRQGRPRSTFREVFLRRRAPVRPLGATALWPIVGRRLRALGVSLPHCGPHSLRHACATHLLSEGLSLKEIGDYLGHQQADATRVYAKVDLIGLRQVGDFDMGGLL